MVKNLVLNFSIIIPILFTSISAQDADPIEAARQAKLAAEKAAADAEAATGAAIEAAASRAAAEAREKVIADREAEKARKLAEKEAAENAEIDAAAEAAALEARRKLAAELGLEIDEVPDSTISEELNIASDDEVEDDVNSGPLEDFKFGLSSALGFVNGEAFSEVPLGGTIVVSTPYGFKVGPLNLTASFSVGGYSAVYKQEGEDDINYSPIFVGVGANGILSNIVFSETQVGLVGKGLGIRNFSGVTLDRIFKNLKLPVNILVGGEGFISTNIDGNDVSTYWGGLGVRLDLSL